MMPKYFYRCSECNAEFTYFHSMTEKKLECESCKKETLNKIPTRFLINTKEDKKNVGDVVKKSIEDFEKDLKLEKEKISNEYYDEN